jgi:GNAT superfamily N-acetyltransferase
MSKKEPARHILIQPASAARAEQMSALMGAIYDCEPTAENQCFTPEMFRHHLTLFPEGQFIAIDAATDAVIGITVSLRTEHDPAHPVLASWWDTVGQGWLTTHQPNGQWMYGAESCVHPAYRGNGVGSRLMDARFDTLRRLNLRGMVAGSAIIDYGAVRHEVTPEAYVQDVIAGRRFDTNLTKQLHKGFRASYLIPDYVMDEWTGRYGVCITWENPDYREV